MIGYAKGIAAIVVLVALTGAWYGVKRHYVKQGRAEVQAVFDKYKAGLVLAENKAIIDRVDESKKLAEKQRIDNLKITKVKDDELAKVRADLASSERLRRGKAICARPATATNTESTSISDATDTGGGAFREDVERDIRALILQTEEVAATARACQAFVIENGLTP